MSSTEEHVVMANYHLGRADGPDATVGDAQVNAALALAQATLALVEEQRTANLIAALAAGFHLGHDYEDTAWADEVDPRLHYNREDVSG